MTSHCLDCGAELHGRYCAQCGQRATPPHPTMREMVVDAWHELTVFDSRLARTVTLLLRRPGELTHEYLAGKRSRYILPLRMYLIASVAYFLVAAFVPDARPRNTAAKLPGKDDVTIDLMQPDPLSPEEREKARKSVERAPGVLKPMFIRVIDDPAGVRRNMQEAMPRVFFVLVPVFAGIVAIFFWRSFPQHLVFSLHLHAAIFTVFAVQHLSNLTRSAIVVGVFQFAALVFVVSYTVRAFRRTYGDRWVTLLLKMTGVFVLYMLAAVAAVVGAFVWSTVVQ